MTNQIDEFIKALDPKARGRIKGTAKLVVPDLGSVMLDENGAKAGDDDADVVMIASLEVFQNIFDGSQNPTMAAMTGKLKVEGNAMRALKVSEILVN